MPKIRDLGINVIPETMRPPEIGEGGGCGATYATPCGGTIPCLPGTFVPPPYPYGAGGTAQCPAATFPCLPGTFGPTGNYTMQCPAATFPCLPGTFGPGYYPADPDCTPGTRVTTPIIVNMTATQTGNPAAGALTREAIELLKHQLHQQIAQLDEIAKSTLPKTIEEIDAREQQLRAELEELANCRRRLESGE